MQVHTQVRDLEAELEAEQRRHREASAAARKFERQLKELQMASEEDRRMVIELGEQVSMLMQKIKVYKRQVEEAVSIGIRPLLYNILNCSIYTLRNTLCLVSFGTKYIVLSSIYKIIEFSLHYD